MLAPDLDEPLQLSNAERALFDAINRLRRNPASFGDMIAERRVPHYDDESGALVLGRVAWETYEGRAAAEEAVAYLRSLSPLRPPPSSDGTRGGRPSGGGGGGGGNRGFIRGGAHSSFHRCL